ncbi:MAG TPA: hypothetical protein DIU35_10335 [Candidatus Latescibacteria bacterium]|nr:hypothetical protein [Gemmatimonadota bacterium]HCR17869.1 hypothetical protein [Candidatus Latescibacterota bacterium]|tara:strand:+ start:1057 stop:1431 length:375 start_codon:yes stop_codon:yes gene_type:complete
MDETDSQLVAETLRGDNRSFDRLVIRYYGAVYSLAYHWMQDFTEAQDVTQNTLFQAYKTLGHLKDPEKFAAWLQSIASNFCRIWQGQQDRIHPHTYGRKPRWPTGHIQMVIRKKSLKLRSGSRF